MKEIEKIVSIYHKAIGFMCIAACIIATYFFVSQPETMQRFSPSIDLLLNLFLTLLLSMLTVFIGTPILFFISRLGGTIAFPLVSYLIIADRFLGENTFPNSWDAQQIWTYSFIWIGISLAHIASFKWISDKSFNKYTFFDI